MVTRFTFFLVLMSLGFAFDGHAQCSPYIANDSTQWMVGGAVRATAVKGNTLYLGGDFTTIGKNTGHFVGIDTATGKPINLTSWPKVNGEVYKAIPDGAGGWIIGGQFTKVGDSLRKNLAQIDAGGHVTLFNPQPDDVVRSLLLVGSNLYVGGQFTHIGGLAKNRLTRVSFPAGAVAAWSPNANNVVVELNLYNGKLYVGGSFTNIGGQARSCIAAIDTATGNAYGWNPNATGASFILTQVQTITFHAGIAYVGGGFFNIGGQSRNNIAALDTGTGLATSWNPGASSYVSKIINKGATLYVAGAFTSIGTASRSGFAEIDSAYGYATSFYPTTMNYPFLNDMVQSGNKLFLAGGYSYTPGLLDFTNYIGVIDIAASTFKSEWTMADNDVYTLAVSGGTVYAGGAFKTMGYKRRYRAAAIDMSADTITNWDPMLAYGTINAIAIGPTKVYIGGDFTTLYQNGGFVTANFLAATDPLTGKNDTGYVSTIEYPSIVRKIIYDGGNLYISGNFAGIGTYTRNGVAKLSATTGALNIPWDPASFFSLYINDLAVDNSNVYIGGGFSTLGGLTRRNLGAVDKVTGHATAWNPSPNSTVTALSLNNGKLYVGGYFDSIGAGTHIYAPRLARVSLSSGVADTWLPQPDGAVKVIKPYYNSQYISGQFDHIGTTTINGLGSVSNSSNIPNSWNPHPGYDSVYDIAIWGDRMYVAGGFTTISGQNQYPNLILYKLVAQPDTVRISTVSPICAGSTIPFTASTGITGGSYQWKVNGVSVGTSASSYSYTPAEGDVVTCIYTPPAGGCYTDSFATSNAITVHLTPALTPTVSVTGPNPVCYGSSATYTSVTSVPSLLRTWRVNGVFSGTGTSYSYTPANGDVIACKITVAPGNCYTADTAISPGITLAVGPPVVPAIVLSAPATQSAGTIVTVNATVSSAGSSYQVNWYRNGTYSTTTTTRVYTFTKSAGTDIISATVIPLSSGCYDSASANTVYVYQATSVAGLAAANGISVYPNPFDNKVFVDGLQAGDRVCVYDVNGTKRTEVTISDPKADGNMIVPSLAPGLYFLFVTDKDATVKAKVSISKQ